MCKHLDVRHLAFLKILLVQILIMTFDQFLIENKNSYY